MRKSTRNLLALAAVTVLLGIGVYAELVREHRWLEAQRLTDIDPVTIKSLVVRCDSCTTRRFERTTSGWRMLEPYALPASPGAIAHLLSIARAPVHTWLSASDHDPDRLGLRPAQVTLQLDTTRIDIGNEDPIDHDRYVRVGQRLARVPDRFSARLFESAESELDRHLLPGNPDVASIEIDDAPARTDLAHVWKTVMATGVRAAQGTAPAQTIPITVNLHDGRSIRFRLLRAAKAYVVRRQQPPLDYLIDEIQAQTLLGKLK